MTFAFFAALLFSVSSPAAARSVDAPALVLEKGTIAQRQLVAVGRGLIVLGEARQNAVAIGGEIEIVGEVAGDVISLGGSVRLADGAVIGGDVCALGGVVELGEGAKVGGRSLAYPNAPSAFLLLLEGPALGLSPTSPVVIAAKLSLIASWMLVSLALLRFFPRPMDETVETVSNEPFRCFFAGLTATLGGVLVLAMLTAVMAPIAGVPIAALLILLAVLLKLWGLVAVFGGLGRWLFQSVGKNPWRTVISVQATLLGLVLLSTVKMTPYLGTGVWTVVSLVGVGAALISRFGQGEPSPSVS
ncbi:MAG: hypothetical protein AAGA81_17200 [Acidobacteriota bacterium]